MVRTVEASAFYRKHLGSEVLGVPESDGDRLSHWPPLQPADTMRITGSTDGYAMQHKRYLLASADLVLSSAGLYLQYTYLVTLNTAMQNNHNSPKVLCLLLVKFRFSK